MTRTHTLPAGTMATPLTIKPTTSHAYYDVMDTLAKFGDEPVAYAPILRSMTWMIDTSVINAARSVLFELYKEAEIEGSERDAFGDFCQEVGEVVAAESWYADEAGDNPVKALADLMAIRNEWHDIAQSAHSRDDRDYNPRGLRELLEAEKPRTVGVAARENLQMLAERQAKGDAEKAKRNLDALLKRDAAQAADRAAGNRKLIPTIMAIVEAAARHAEHSVRFDQLSVAVQRRLVKSAVSTVERTIENDVAKRRDLSTLAFMRILDVNDEVLAELGDVLKTRLADDGELENVSMTHALLKHERAQKARAVAAV